MSGRTGVGVVGAGVISQTYLENLTSFPDIAVVAVGEILYQAQAGYSFSYNPSPLTLGALAYLVLFMPVVWLGRWIETRFAWRR